ncbi:nodulation protein G [Rhodovulum sulfidophilum]|uniref:Nodulation protein G n=1 Tax=Rhodovulum sulfidophilum TaxID=35806 RepID=A0A0D6B8B0_RHOSU|nr:nodulation protein G [Rhodovulum sulfidophilum]
MADTAMMPGGMTEAQLEGFRPAIPIAHYATCGELDAPTVFLLSSRPGDITGTRLHLNGGQSMV